MSSLTWNGGSGDWSASSNWTALFGPDLTPAAGVDATINASGAYIVTISGTQSVDNLTLDNSGATLAVTGGPLPTGTLTIGGSFTGLAGTLDLTHGGLSIANSQTLDNLAISYFGPIGTFSTPFTLANGAVLTLGPHTVTTGAISSSPITIFSQGNGAVVNEGTLTTPAFPGAVNASTDIDNEGSLNVGYLLNITGNLINNGRISFTTSLTPDSMTVSGDLLGVGQLVLPSFGTLPGAPVTVTGTIGALAQIIGPINGVFSLTAGAIDPTALIYNFYNGSTIDLTGLPFSDSLQADFSGNKSIGTLLIDNGATQEAALGFVGLAKGSAFTLAPDGGPSGGTVITTNVPIVACFVAGTRIRTDRGEVAVEALRVGDRVPVRAGASLPIVWIGHRRMQPNRHPRPAEVYPVRVAAGAFADFVPSRDLWLSPEQCVFLHGVLVPVGVLVNGHSIVQVPCDAVTYWHIELSSHDLVLSEGAWTESYLDMGNRAAFEGTEGDAGRVLALHPDFSRDSWEGRACQQQERGGPIVAAIRAAIDARAARISKAA